MAYTCITILAKLRGSHFLCRSINLQNVVKMSTSFDQEIKVTSEQHVATLILLFERIKQADNQDD